MKNKGLCAEVFLGASLVNQFSGETQITAFSFWGT